MKMTATGRIPDVLALLALTGILLSDISSANIGTTTTMRKTPVFAIPQSTVAFSFTGTDSQHQRQQRQRQKQHEQRRRLVHQTAAMSSSVGEELNGVSDPMTLTTIDDTKKKTKSLALLTFDLDDTLYPIAPVIEEANAAFARSSKQYGFTDIQPGQINAASKRFRERVAETEGKEAAAVLTHTDIRKGAIREAMEESILQRKLYATMDEESTAMESLSPVLVSHAKRWAASKVSDSIVQAVLQAWEMERHHAAERHLYPEVVDALRKIREQHPDVIIGAVTDGKANPLLMTFTLAPFFDFCMSWEDDQGGRSNFFKELGSTSSNADLKWIYRAAVEKYQELAQARQSLEGKPVEIPDFSSDDEDKVWIHVGDDLAYDVGGASQCGARTIYCELAEKYGQTARQRFDFSEDSSQPSWSTNSRLELEKRKIMSDAALDSVDAKLAFMGRLSHTINDVISPQV